MFKLPFRRQLHTIIWGIHKQNNYANILETRAALEVAIRERVDKDPELRDKHTQHLASKALTPQ